MTRRKKRVKRIQLNSIKVSSIRVSETRSNEKHIHTGLKVNCNGTMSTNRANRLTFYANKYGSTMDPERRVCNSFNSWPLYAVMHAKLTMPWLAVAAVACTQGSMLI